MSDRGTHIAPSGDTEPSGINRQDPPSQVPGLCLSDTSGADFDRPTHGGRTTASVEGGEGIPGPARDSDRGTRIPLPSRSFVRPPVDERMSPRAPHPAFDAAGAHKPEPDPPQGVAAVPFFVDPESHSAYGDAVREHRNQSHR